MNQPPSKDEILAAFRAVLNEFEGGVEVAPGEPNARDLANDGVFMQFLGRLRGWLVFAKKNAFGIVLGICLYGDFWQGVNTIRSHSQIAYDSIASCLKYTKEHSQQDVEFVISQRPQQWPLPPDDPIRFVTTTTTTTRPPTTSPPPSDYIDIPSGSGIVPRSTGWQGYT